MIIGHITEEDVWQLVFKVEDTIKDKKHDVSYDFEYKLLQDH